jgi:hypothetical protein
MTPRCRAVASPTNLINPAQPTMTSAPSRLPAGTKLATDSTPVPKSYAKGIAMTPDPWDVCLALEYGGDRSFAWSILQQVTRTSPAGWGKIEERLLAALATPACTPAACAFFCEMLALVGSAKSVPALAALLRNPTTTEPARYALEAIPGPEVDTALRQALADLKGDAKAGLLGSIAARRDQAASPANPTSR